MSFRFKPCHVLKYYRFFLGLPSCQLAGKIEGNVYNVQVANDVAEKQLPVRVFSSQKSAKVQPEIAER